MPSPTAIVTCEGCVYAGRPWPVTYTPANDLWICAEGHQRNSAQVDAQEVPWHQLTTSPWPWLISWHLGLPEDGYNQRN